MVHEEKVYVIEEGQRSNMSREGEGEASGEKGCRTRNTSLTEIRDVPFVLLSLGGKSTSGGIQKRGGSVSTTGGLGRGRTLKLSIWRGSPLGWGGSNFST